jgi:hypothetical protein
MIKAAMESGKASGALAANARYADVKRMLSAIALDALQAKEDFQRRTNHQGVKSMNFETDGKSENTERPMASREMTVEEVIDARIEGHNRHIADLMAMKDQLHHSVRSSGISRFERLFGALFDRQNLISY